MSDEAPSVRARILCALGIGIAAGLFAFFLESRPHFWPDFVFPWKAARLLLAGIDPYRALPGGLAEPYESPLLYPLPTVLATVPVAHLPLPVAGGIVMGFSAALLAFLLTREAWWRLWTLGSAPFVMAINFGQWSPLVMAAALLPAIGGLVALKPNIGLAAFAYRPSRAMLIGGALIGVASLAALPAWPLEWLRAVRSLPGHPAPIVAWHGAGIFLALAALRWRTPEGRLLLVSACVPQLLFFADQLPLWLIPRTRQELVLMSGSSLIGVSMWFVTLTPGEFYVPAAQPWVLLFVYLPALIIVLRRRDVTRDPTP